jgi:GGDEF domain-containing protein/CHASE3 domain sensor protein
LIRLTVSQKITAGYLLIIIFCLGAIIYALTALSRLTAYSEQLVTNEFRALGLARDLSGSMLDQERLEKQILILRDSSMVPLLDKRHEESSAIMGQLSGIPLSCRFDYVEKTFVAFDEGHKEARALLEKKNWAEAELFSRDVVAPRRERLFKVMEMFRTGQETLMDENLQDFTLQSSEAYRLTLALAFAGIGFAALVATGIILKIHRSGARLTRATKEIASGSFDHPIDIDGKDEFGRLARDFAEMGRKLRELQILHLDANPLTRLPGNLTIQQELETRIASGRPFAHIYIDLDYFKAYNDRYGYHSGSDIIFRVGTLIQEVDKRCGSPEDMIGHIGGDDYVVLSTPDLAETIAAELIREFDAIVPEFYTEADRQAGFFMEKDRYGEERRFPLLSMSIAIVSADNLRNPSAEAIGRECAKIKEHLKKLPGSNFLMDRRERR